MLASVYYVLLIFPILQYSGISLGEALSPYLSLYSPGDPEYTDVIVRRVGDNLTLVCELKGDATPRIYVWKYVPSDNLTDGESPYKTEPRGPTLASRFIKRDVQISDSGHYVCSAPEWRFSISKYVLVQNRSADFENYPAMGDTPTRPPPYTDSMRYKLFGPPPQYLSRDCVSGDSENGQREQSARSNVEMPPCYDELSVVNGIKTNNNNVLNDNGIYNNVIFNGDNNVVTINGNHNTVTVNGNNNVVTVTGNNNNNNNVNFYGNNNVVTINGNHNTVIVNGNNNVVTVTGDYKVLNVNGDNKVVNSITGSVSGNVNNANENSDIGNGNVSGIVYEIASRVTDVGNTVDTDTGNVRGDIGNTESNGNFIITVTAATSQGSFNENNNSIKNGANNIFTDNGIYNHVNFNGNNNIVTINGNSNTVFISGNNNIVNINGDNKFFNVIGNNKIVNG